MYKVWILSPLIGNGTAGNNYRPPASEYGQMVAYLARLGIKASDIRKRIGSAPNNRNRAEIVQALKEWLKTGVV